MAKIILLTGSFVGYAYAMEFFVAWYSGNSYERFAFWNRIFGPYWWYWWVGMLFCKCLSPQLFWFRWCRRNILVVYFVCMCVNAGMWFERFIIIVGGCIAIFCRPPGDVYHPTWVDIWTFIGTLGIFTSLFLLFIRFLPMIAMSEVKNRLARSGSSLRDADRTSSGRAGRKGAHMMRTPSGHKVYAMAAEYPSAAALYEAAKTRARCRVQTLGCLFAVPDPRNGRRDGPRKIVAERRGFVRRRSAVCSPLRFVEFGPSWFLYPSIVHGKPIELVDRAGVFPDHVRADGALLGSFAAFFAVLIMNGLPRWNHPMFNWNDSAA